MDAELKQKWVTALRSGEFKQGRGALEEDGTFCCLGVLCRVTGRPTTHKNGGPNRDRRPLPLELLNFEQQWRLTAMNDAGKTFPEIASYIEANL
jgi:hypothetical protein